MQAGKLDRRVIIQQTTQSADASGERVDSWSTLATVWAGITYNPGDEKIEGQQITASQKIVWEIRYRSDVTENMRISWNSKYYYITSIEEIGRQDGLRLTTEVRD